MDEEVSPIVLVQVAEDDESFSDALSYMLRKEGFEVAVCPTGPAALEAFDRHGADLVLLDPMLPGPRHRSVPEPARTVGGAADHAQRQGHRERRLRLLEFSEIPSAAGREWTRQGRSPGGRY